MTETRLARVEAPHFVAGVLLRGGRVVFAAPILRWATNKTEEAFLTYCQRKGWSVQVF